jgi:uncharacterized protein (TIGR02466 family)
MNIENLYATPVLIKKLDNYMDVNYDITKSINDINWHTKKEWGEPNHISTIDFGDDIIKSKNFFGLSNAIDSCLKEYCKEIDFVYREYNRKSWILKIKKGHFAHSHNHAPTDISGVYYYQTNENDGHFFFESPNTYFETSNCFKNKYGQRFLQKPEVGKIIFFPGWLRHGVFLNSSDNDRISISFNINFK